MEQGPKSQATSEACSVGPSSLIDASDLDALSVVSGHALRQSALTLIAFQARTIRCWFRFAWPGKQGKGSVNRWVPALSVEELSAHAGNWHPNTAGIQVPLLTIQRKLSTIAKTTVLSATPFKTPALEGLGRHRLTWRRLCLPCQASAIYEYDLSQDLWWHFAPEQSPTP